ncbi:MAG: InlB B-repeat-containing protein [Firmicutes bacterium]|nr:InlB B-repeat-containing protein [Bacillota bacterium]
MEQQPQNPEQTRPLRGLYRHVKISVRTLNVVIILGIAAIVLCVLFGVAHAGYTVTFDSRGGTDVPSQEHMYQEYVDAPTPPTRDGYVFTGWYVDENCTTAWDFETDVVQGSFTLYAGWTLQEAS